MIRNETRGTVLATDVRHATNPWKRFMGLMGMTRLDPGAALVFPGEKGVHTHFMRFPIDVLYYDGERRVLDVDHVLRPWRFAAIRWRAAGVIELPAGTCRETGTQPGDQLSFS